MEASLVYSVAILHTCLSAKHALFGHKPEIYTAYEAINTLYQSRQELSIMSETPTSSSFQLMANRAVEYFKRCSEYFPNHSDRTFWKLRHHCIWMLIYWLSDTFEAFSELFKAVGIHSPDFHPVSQSCLLLSSLLKKDTEFPHRFFSFIDLKLSWDSIDIDILLIAIEEDDIALLQTVIKNTTIPRDEWKRLWKHAHHYVRFDAMNILLSVSRLRLDSLCKSLLENTNGEDYRRMLLNLHIIGLYIGTSDPTPCLPGMNDLILRNCAEIIYEGSEAMLRGFLNLIQRFRLSFDATDSIPNSARTQLTILPALASQSLYMLKGLSKACAISVSIQAIHSGHHIFMRYGNGTISESIKSFSIFQLPLSLAVGFVSNLDIIQYLCENGARLERSGIDTGFDEPDILQNLRLTTTVSDARKQSCYLKGECYRLCLMRNIDGSGIYESGDDSSRVFHVLSGSLSKIWMTMCRIIFEKDCRHLYDITDVCSELTWTAIQKQLYPSLAQSASVKKAESWPAPLLTQESWDNWRSNVIDLLEKTHQEDFEMSESNV